MSVILDTSDRTRRERAPRLGRMLPLLLVLAGCASQPVLVASRLTPEMRRLGHAEGEACGLPPLNTSSRLQTAVDRALASVNGATALDGVTIDEHWFYVGAVIWCTKVSGEAMK